MRRHRGDRAAQTPRPAPDPGPRGTHLPV